MELRSRMQQLRLSIKAVRPYGFLVVAFSRRLMESMESGRFNFWISFHRKPEIYMAPHGERLGETASVVRLAPGARLLFHFDRIFMGRKEKKNDHYR